MIGDSINPLLEDDNKDNIKNERKQGFSYEVDNPGQRPKGSGEKVSSFFRQGGYWANDSRRTLMFILMKTAKRRHRCARGGDG